jgi:DNA-binding MarR family transcriptional regulator
MPPGDRTGPQACNCLALRQATRHVTQLYDLFMAPLGLRSTQFSILARLKLNGPMTINALATELVMDRTTLGRNILPLERDGLLEIAPGRTDRRRKELHLTRAGSERHRAAAKAWREAQERFESVLGGERASELRALLRTVTMSEFVPPQEDAPD